MAQMAVFDNSTFVDTGGTTSDESDNVQATLASLAHTVTTFTATDAAGLAAALVGKDAFVLPEMENDLYTPDAAAEAVIEAFVTGGGTLIIHGSGRSADFINSVFEFSVVETFTSGGSSSQTVAGAALPGAPASLADNNATFKLSNLPLGTIIYYLDGTGAAVAEIPFGSGSILYFGFDWFNAQPAGTQDGGWIAAYDAVIDSALVDLNTGPVTQDDEASTNENTAVAIDVLANDTDPDGDTQSITNSNIRGQGNVPPGESANGLSNDGTQLRFDPNAYTDPTTGVTGFDYLGVGETATILIDYDTMDSAGNPSSNDYSTVTLTINGVNDGPNAVNDFNSAVEDAPPATGNVLFNDDDVDTNDMLTVTNAGSFQLTYGTLTLNADGSYSYSADADLLDTIPTGTAGLQDQFTYSISDGNGGTDTATLTIAVSTANDDRTQRGGSGNDTISGDRDGVIGAEDTIFGGTGADTLFGLDGADNLFGGSGNDILDGGRGRDRLSGETGNDRLTGGDGADVFLFAAGNGNDVVTDFQVGEDRLELNGTRIRSRAERDVDGNGTLDTVLGLTSGSVTLLNVSGVPNDVLLDPTLFMPPPMETSLAAQVIAF